MWRIISLTVALLASSATSAIAQEGDRPPPPPHFMQNLLALDTNYDAGVSRQEFMAHAEAEFARLDTNHDKVLDDEDRPPMWGGPPGERRERGPDDRRWGHSADDDRGERDRGAWRHRELPREPITRAAFLERAAEHFRHLDTNHNGRLSGGELERPSLPEEFQERRPRF